MALLPILEFPDPRLRTRAVDVDPAELATPAFQALLDDMFETMYEAPGIGLAASQVDVHKRFMVIDVSEEHDAPRVLSTQYLAVARLEVDNARTMGIDYGTPTRYAWKSKVITHAWRLSGGLLHGVVFSLPRSDESSQAPQLWRIACLHVGGPRAVHQIRR